MVIKGKENPRLNLCFDPNTQPFTAAVWAHCYGLTGHRAICVLETASAPWSIEARGLYCRGGRPFEPRRVF